VELVLVIIAIVYSIWSEVNKQKQEKNVDFDFSELASIDDFLKKQNEAEALEPLPVSQLPTRQERKNRRQQKKSEPNQNWHSPDHSSGMMHTESQSLMSEQGRREQETGSTLASDSSTGRPAGSSFINPFIRPTEQQDLDLKLDRSNLVKAFIMSEVMTRYDINRIYERVPGVRQDEE